MAQHEPDKIRVSSLNALLHINSGSFTEGYLEWIRPGGTAKGEISAVLVVQGCRNGRLMMTVNIRSPFRPTFAFVVNDVPAYRVCLNSDTAGVQGTHGHRYQPGSGAEIAISLAGRFGMIKDKMRPGSDDLRKAFEEFAGLVNVDLNDGYWVDPWEEDL